MNGFMVALGGGIGALLRYGISLLPISGRFPLATLLTNFLGAFCIGLIAACAARLSPRATLLLKTGMCGGFTTFSTFSLESVSLFQQGRYGAGSAYVALSMALCFGGTALGLWLGQRMGQQ